MLVLGIETSCDETAFAVVEDGRRVLSNAVASQADVHARFGGVVPEIASRAHLEELTPTYRRALADAGVTMGDVGAIAVTRGPGLAGCLLTGVEYAKGLALRFAKPLASVHHVAGHLVSTELGREMNAWGEPVAGDRAPWVPYMALAASGGHTSLVHVRGPLEYEIIGQTLDDAAGEAYDKAAKLLGLGYPGGPVMDRLAAQGDPGAYDLPRPVMGKAGSNFSFSGLKTAVSLLVRDVARGEPTPEFQRDAAASFQAAVIDVLLAKAARAIEEAGTGRFALVGGVASNRGLRAAAAERLAGIEIGIPPTEFCTDNAAMIAALGWHVIGTVGPSTLGLNAAPSLSMEDVDRWK